MSQETETDKSTEPMRSIGVKRLPQSTWLRCKQNALLSNLSLTDFIIRVLDQSTPYPPTGPYGKGRPRPSTRPLTSGCAPSATPGEPAS